MADTSFEEKGMLAIIAISASAGIVLHFAYDVPWFSAGAVPTHVVFLLGVGLPLLFASIAYLIKSQDVITQYESFNETKYKQELKIQKENSVKKDEKKIDEVSFDSEAMFKTIPYLSEVYKT